jgi:hypothetical protein
MISPTLTFAYRFTVQKHELRQPEPAIHGQDDPFDVAALEKSWAGQGTSRSLSGKRNGIVGPRPEFVLYGGWLTLRASDGWTQPFPVGSFSDADPRNRSEFDTVTHLEDLKNAFSVAIRSGQIDHALLGSAMKEANKQRGRSRDLKLYSLYVGGALARVLQLGDELHFSRHGTGAFGYSVRRNSEPVFGVGPVDQFDEGGPFAVWGCQQTPPLGEMGKSPSTPEERLEQARVVGKWFASFKFKVKVRIKDQLFDLLDGQDLCRNPYYVLLTRTDAVDFPPEAIHAAGHLDVLGKDLIVNAARQVIAPQTRML